MKMTKTTRRAARAARTARAARAAYDTARAAYDTARAAAYIAPAALVDARAAYDAARAADTTAVRTARAALAHAADCVAAAAADTNRADNGITRDAVWVQWQEMGQPLPAGTNFPTTWPPNMRYWLEFIGRRASRADVDAVVSSLAHAPLNVMVTRDPGARVGWTPVESFFVR